MMYAKGELEKVTLDFFPLAAAAPHLLISVVLMRTSGG